MVGASIYTDLIAIPGCMAEWTVSCTETLGGSREECQAKWRGDSYIRTPACTEPKVIETKDGPQTISVPAKDQEECRRKAN